MSIRLLTTVKLQNYYPDELDIHTVAEPATDLSRLRKVTRLWAQVTDFDVFLSLSPSIEHMALAGLHRLFFRKTKIIFFDIVLQKPTTLSEKLKAFLQRVFLVGVDVFLLVHKDYRLYQLYYRIPTSKIKYVAFKANNYEILQEIVTSDDGYVLSCGASFRDYDCLIEVARQLPELSFVILKPAADRAAMHKAQLQSGDLPANVKIAIDDMSQKSWNNYIAHAKLVVIPIRKDCIQPAGISTYLEAMTLEKPVIVSRGPSTEQLLTDDMALTFESGAANELRQCIQRLITDEQLRSHIATNGRRYALSLEGRERLVKELERHAIEIHRNRPN
jgi:glycosyltransferase involved in cell wall biosynthesis